MKNVSYLAASACHAPNPGPTLMADPNRFPGRETQDWDSLPDIFFFFFLKPYWYLWVWPTSYNRIKILNTNQKNYHRSGVPQIYTLITESHLLIQNYTFPFTNQSTDLHVVNPFKCVGLAICGSLQMSSPVPTRMKNPC